MSGYYPTWEQAGYLTPGDIDFSAMSEVDQFAIIPRADGTIDNTPGKTVTPQQSAAVVSAAHAAGLKAFITIGGEGTLDIFRAAISADGSRARLVSSLVQFALSRDYDGIDIDFEPLQDQDTGHYEAFIRALRTQMDASHPRPRLLLTAAVVWQPALFARLQNDFDQINIMTYDMSGPWKGFKTWHNGPLHGAGAEQMAENRPYPSIEESVAQFVQAGVSKRKLGIGIAFYGDVWSGADAPKEPITGVTQTQIAYHEIMDQYFQPERYRWDAQAHASYLSIPAPQPGASKFISYDDERLCAEKVRYAQHEGLGGVIIWELGDGYRADQPPGQRDRLLQAVKRAWLTGGRR